MSNIVASAAALPWRLMVRPVSGWHELSGRQILFHSLAWQWLIFCMAELVALPVMQQISNTQLESKATVLHTSGILLGYIPLVILLNAAFAGLCWLLFRVIGLPRTYSEFLQWTTCGMLPFAIGALLGRISLELLHPQGMYVGFLAPLQFRGISIGLANWLPQNFPPMEFAWVSLGFLDFCGIWSFILLALGLRHYLKASRQESILGSLALLILCFVILTGVWQLAQRLAGPAQA